MRPNSAFLLRTVLLAAAVGCASSGPEKPAVDDAAFSASRAWAHLRALVELGPRVTGTPGGIAARDYLREELARIGLELREDAFDITSDSGVKYVEGSHLTGILHGESQDIIFLAAHYDTQRFEEFSFVGANDGGSGPALLLELARVLSLRKPPYTVWFSFLDAEMPLRPGGPPDERLLGSRALAHLLLEEGVLAKIRIGVVFDQVADAELRIARDLRSHRTYREIFWSAAARMGRQGAFPSDAPFDAPLASHLAFNELGMRRMVAIVDSRYGGEAEPGTYAGTEHDTLEHCAPESLETVGIVTLAALDDIMDLLQRVDRYARRPALEPAPSAPLPEDAAQSQGTAP